MSKRDITIKDLVTVFQKHIEDPNQSGSYFHTWNYHIKYGSDDDGFYFILRNKKYRCFNKEIKSTVKLTSPETTFDPRTDILICQDTFLASNNDPMEKYVLMRITDTDMPGSNSSISCVNYRGIRGKNDNEVYVTGLEITCTRTASEFLLHMDRIIEFLNESVSVSYIDKDKTNSRDQILQYFKQTLESLNISTKTLENGFCFTLKDKKYTCGVEKIAYFKLNDDLSFNPKTDILISTDVFTPDDKKRSDRFVVIKVLNKDQEPQKNRIMDTKSYTIYDDNKKDVGILVEITLFWKNSRLSKCEFERIFRSILQFLIKKDA